MKLRIDIQIMRGLAVLMVVLFHLNYNFLSNGFLGVDLFFVISGFLMAVLYKKGTARDFFLRRASRLLPAYYATVIITVFFSSFITLPSEHAQVSNQGIFATFFLSNIGYWLQDSYFDSGLFKPLLHLWSLGVEIQFYLFVPLLLWLHWKNKFIFFLILLGTFISCFFIVKISPYTAFFLTPFRVWQFLIGATIAIYFTNKGNIKYHYPIFGLIGIIIILGLIILFPIDGKATSFVYGHPGIASLLVSLASGLTLIYGLPKFILQSGLGKLFKKLGDWSYSIYLAHFPVIVLYLYKPFSGTIFEPNDFLDTLTIIFIITLFSFIIYNLFDKKRWSFKSYSLFILISISLLTIFLSNQINKKGYTEKDINILSYELDKPLYRCGKSFRLFNPKSDYCELTKHINNSDKKIILIGDSHADSIKESLVKIAQKNNFHVFFPIHSPPILSKTSSDRVIKIAKEVGARTIIAHYRYTNALSILEKDFIKKVQDNNLSLYWISPTPGYDFYVPDLLWESKLNKNTLSIPIDTEYANLVKSKLKEQNVVFFDPYPAFCIESKCEISSENGKPYYFDKHHLTRTGAQKLEPYFEDWFNIIENQ